MGHEFDLTESRDVVGHVTHIPFSIGGPLEASLCDSTLNVVDFTLIRPLNKGQGNSFWYQSISHNTASYRLSIVTFALGRTVQPQSPQYIQHR